MNKLSLLAVIASLVLANAAMADNSGAAAASGMVQFKIKGVGKGVFANAVIESKPGKASNPDGGLCLTLEGGSRDNSPALIRWVSSNSAGAALATKPDAILTVSTSQNGLRKGKYYFSRITVADYTKKADQDLSHPRLDAIKVNCDTLKGPSSGSAG